MKPTAPPTSLQSSTPRLTTLALVAILSATGLIGGCQDTSQSKNDIRLALNWYPEPEHGGYYAALLNGHFERAGLNVTILPGGPSAPVVEKLVRGQVEAGLSNADQILLKRKQDADVVTVLAPLQTSPRCILVHAESGITDFQGLSNVRLAASPGRPFLEYLKSQVPLENVKMVPYSGRISTFLLSPDYAQQGYVFSEPILARREGAEVNVLKLPDIGFNPYASCLLLRRDTLENDPDLARRFVTACQLGWRDYLKDPTDVNRHLLELNDELDAEMLKQAHEVLVELCRGPDSQPLGAMTTQRWATLKDQLVSIEQIPDSLDEQLAFDNSFLDSTVNQKTEPATSAE